MCAAFDVDGLRADLVTARAAIAHAAWEGRDEVTAVDVRAAARLALPHRRRRQPFDAPQLDEDELDRALAGAGEDPDDDPGPGDDGPGGGDPGASHETAPGSDAPPPRESAGPQRGSPQGPASPEPGQPRPGSAAARPPAAPGPVFRVKRLEVPGTGSGAAGRRSRARTDSGHVTGAQRPTGPGRPGARARHVRRGRALSGGQGPGPGDRLLLRTGDLREARHEGRESNLVLFAVDASGSMAARARMGAVKGAVLSLLLDAYQRRDKVGMVTFRGSGAEVALPPTFSVEAAAARLAAVPTGGRTPLAAGLLRAGELLRTERIRDPRRRALLVLVTDGRATGGPDPVAGAHRARGPAGGGGRAQRGRRLRVRPGPARPGRRPGPVPRRRRAPPGTPGRRALGRLGESAQGGGLMPQGKPLVVPDDGLTTRQRRNRALIVVHTGEMKGKSTAAFGLALRAWNQGWPIVVYQFVKSAKWKTGEESALLALARVHEQTGEGAPVTWHKMGEGWSWIARPGTEADHAANAREGWEQVKRDLAAQAYGFYVLDEFTYPMKWGWVDTGDVVATLAARPGHQHVVITGRDADPRLVEAADLVVRMTKIKHPMDAGQKGQKGIEW